MCTGPMCLSDQGQGVITPWSDDMVHHTSSFLMTKPDFFYIGGCNHLANVREKR